MVVSEKSSKGTVESPVTREQPLRQEFLAVDARADGTMRMEERRRVTGGIHEASAQGERATRAGDESRFVDAHARVQGLERRQRDAQVGRLRLGRQLDHGEVDARGTERVLHDAGGQPQRRVAPDNDEMAESAALMSSSPVSRAAVRCSNAQ